MRILRYTVASLLLVTTLTGGTASARDIEWCAEDPVFQVLGSTFRLTTNVAAAASDVSGIAYVVTLPSDAEGDAAVRFPRSSRLPTTVELRFAGPASAGGSFAVSATVTVAAASNAEVRIDLAGPSVTAASFSGRANKPVRLHFDTTAR